MVQRVINQKVELSLNYSKSKSQRQLKTSDASAQVKWRMQMVSAASEETSSISSWTMSTSKVAIQIKETVMVVTVSMDHLLKMSRYGFLISIRVSSPQPKTIAMAIWARCHKLWSTVRTSEAIIILNSRLTLSLKKSRTLSTQSSPESSMDGTSWMKLTRLKPKS